MLHEIICAGFGGQGVLLFGQILAYAGMLEGKEVSWYPSYGPEMRGGTANCTTVVSDRRIGSPVVSAASAVVALNQPSLIKFQKAVRPGGVLLYNSSLIQEEPECGPGIRTLGLTASEIAADLGSDKVTNMVLLGALLEITGAVARASVEEALRLNLPAHRQNLLPLNYAALRKGAELVG